MHYAVNDSEWSEGMDINLMNLKKAPLNLVVSMPPEMHIGPSEAGDDTIEQKFTEFELLLSKAAYFTQW
jgi:hypothetical protein